MANRVSSGNLLQALPAPIRQPLRIVLGVGATLLFFGVLAGIVYGIYYLGSMLFYFLTEYISGTVFVYAPWAIGIYLVLWFLGAWWEEEHGNR